MVRQYNAHMKKRQIGYCGSLPKKINESLIVKFVVELIYNDAVFYFKLSEKSPWR